MKVVKTVRNLSRVEQFTVWGGQRHAIPPLNTAIIKSEIADQLVRECHPLVKMVEEVEAHFDPDWVGPRVWLYNATGDKDLPERVIAYRIENKHKVAVQIDNPHRKPKLAIHVYDRGQRRRTDGGEGFESLGSIPIEFYPYTRRSLPKHVADWVLARDSMVEAPGEIKRAKEPGFEPDDTWEYEDICSYASLLGLHYRKEITINNNHKKGMYGSITLEQAYDDEKLGLLHQIFFKVCHPQTPVVTEEMFESVQPGFRRETAKISPRVTLEKRSKKPARQPPRKGTPEVEYSYAERPEDSDNTSAFVGD